MSVPLFVFLYYSNKLSNFTIFNILVDKLCIIYRVIIWSFDKICVFLHEHLCSQVGTIDGY